jgi:hypothetical protein
MALVATTSLERSHRQHVRAMEAVFNQHLAAVAESVAFDRRHVNGFAIKDLADAEGRARFEIAEDFDELHRREQGARRLVAERTKRLSTLRGNTLQLGLNKLGRLERSYDARAEEEEERFRQDGLRLLALERADEEQKQLRLDARRQQMKADMEGFTAVKAFVESDQTRQRAGLEKSEQQAIDHLTSNFARELSQVEVRAKERREAEVRARQMNDTAAADAARKEQEKRQAEVQRQQQKLINKCTHSRAGKSVFVGSFAKNKCLMCRVKLDPKTNLFVQM